jgi:hypothetical protein
LRPRICSNEYPDLYYRAVDKTAVHDVRRELHVDNEKEPEAEITTETVFPFPFSSGDSLLALTKKHNVRVAPPPHRSLYRLTHILYR